MNENDYGIHLPPDFSAHGHHVDHIIHVMHWFMLVLFVGWLIFFLYTLFKFRARPGHKAAYAPKISKFSSYLEVGVALFEAAILVALALPAWRLLKATIPSARDRMQIRVVAEQFAWNIHYPGIDGVFGRTDPSLMSSDNPLGLDSSDPYAKDDITSINEMSVPVDQDVLIYLSSKDVIHSFGIPVLRVKQDAIPGQVFPVYFKAAKEGEGEIVCSQLCGLGHYRMRGHIMFKSADQHQAWLNEQKESAE